MSNLDWTMPTDNDTLVCPGCRRRARQGCEDSALPVSVQLWNACPAIHVPLHVLRRYHITLHVKDDSPGSDASRLSWGTS